MARPRKSDTPDLSVPHSLTVGLIDRLTCPEGKEQAFLRDSEVPGLQVRVSPHGAKTFVFEARVNKKTMRRKIGAVGAWTIEDARKEARSLAVLRDRGVDPRELARQREVERAAAAAKQALAGVTVGQAWEQYVQERAPFWSELHRLDHERKASPGGKVAKRGTRGSGLTQPGPLHTLMALPLAGLDAATVEAWATREAALRPTSSRLAWRLLKVFLTWCGEQPAYAPLLPAKNPAKTMKSREAFGKAGVKDDVLQRGQLKAWFDQVRGMRSATISAALQVMLLTGARPGEVLRLQWTDVNTKWKSLTIRDKVEGAREIPLTPYVERLLDGLPRANDWVFASAKWEPATKGHKGRWVDTSATGHIAEPNRPHTKACEAANLPGLTPHGLRRSFSSLTEWLEIPAGVVAQIQGHKPSATAEKHYKRRPLELLNLHHQRIERWILEQARIDPFFHSSSSNQT
jgi:integrase